ncbi:MAG: hypothetical protein ABSB82_25185 [Terriglobia bacterium]|jgi:hypothetical protein
MSRQTLDDSRLKELVKVALVEVLEERKDLLRDALEEAIEDMALVRAIQEGAQSRTMTRREMASMLKRH